MEYIEIRWKGDDEEELASAKRKYEEYVRRGWFAFKLEADGTKVHIHSFDPRLGRIVLVPAAEGG